MELGSELIKLKNCSQWWQCTVVAENGDGIELKQQRWSWGFSVVSWVIAGVSSVAAMKLVDG